MTFYLASVAILFLAALTMGVLGHCLYADSAQKAPEPPLEPLRLNRSRAGLPDRLSAWPPAPGFCLPAGNRQPGLGFAPLAVLPSCLTPCPGFSFCLFSGWALSARFSGSIALRHEKGKRAQYRGALVFLSSPAARMALCRLRGRCHTVPAGLGNHVPFRLFFLIDFNDRDSTVRDASWTCSGCRAPGRCFSAGAFVGLWQATGITSLNPAAPCARLLPMRARASSRYLPFWPSPVLAPRPALPPCTSGCRTRIRRRQPYFRAAFRRNDQSWAFMA